MNKFKLPIIIAVVVLAAGAGLFVSGIIGGKSDDHAKKHAVQPVALGDPFLINLTDADSDAILRLGVAVQLEPMDEEHFGNYSGANTGGHGGAGEAPGPTAIASYTKLRDGVIKVASRFSSSDLRTPEGKQELKEELLTEFAAIAERDAAEAKNTAHDSAHDGIGPPYHVADIDFTELIVQAN